MVNIKGFAGLLSAFVARSCSTGLPVGSRRCKGENDAITGHAGSGAGRAYGSGVGLKVLAEEMARIEVPEALLGQTWANPAEFTGSPRRAPRQVNV